MAATLEVTSDTLEMSALDWSKASMTYIRHYRVVPFQTRPLTLLESITKVQTGKSLKRANRLSSDFSFLLSFAHHDSTITAKAILIIQMRKNSINHWVLYPVLIVILELQLFFKHSDVNT